MKNLTINRINASCGCLFVLIGVGFGVQSLNLQIGTALRMGPGYFPLVLSGALILLGLIILVQATRVEGEPLGPIAWRGMLFILVSPILFGLLLRGLGFLPSIFLAALVAGFASARMKLLYALILAAALTAFATLVFVQGLGLPFRLIGPWLGA